MLRTYFFSFHLYSFVTRDATQEKHPMEEMSGAKSEGWR